jgi:hypothetical protein
MLCHGVWGAPIGHAEAMSKARAAISRHQGDTRRAPSSLALELSLDAGNYYVFNSEGGGWAVVAADDRVPQAVLAYSPTGTFDAVNIPDAVKGLLDGYAAEVEALGRHNAVIAPRHTPGRSVAPLLGETAWAQGYPFNLMCPVIDGQRCVTGCVNTAISQIMYYHQHPAVGRGSHTYTTNGLTLSADFSKSVYRWDLMKPVYNYYGSDGDSEESKNAVALLMRDCGIANSTNYGTGESGASLNTPGLIDYFGYDRSLRHLERNNCTRDYYEETLRAELDAGRPVHYEGGSSGGGHAFVCDGYDSEGYFHFNFGWGQGSSGYYLTSATGFDASPGYFYSIMPDAGNPAAITAGSASDFAWEQGNRIACSISCFIHSGTPSTIDTGVEVRNKVTDEVRYIVKRTVSNDTQAYIGEIMFDDAIADGDYRLRAVCRANGGEWVRATFGDMRMSYVDVNVSGGVKTYANEVLDDDMDPGVVRIDGVYYLIDGERAVVTRRNARGASYSGDVVIPATVSYQGHTVAVEEIGEGAFSQSKVNSLVIGRNVRTIAFGSLDFTTIGSLEFEQPSGLCEIGGWGFNACEIDVVRLPEGLTVIGTCAFQSTSMKKLVLPSSVTYISNAAFNYSTQLKDVHVQWRDAASMPTAGNGIFDGCEKSQITLHVPAGCAALYAADPQWGELNIVDDSDSGVADIAGDSVTISADNGRIVVTGLPAGAVATVYDLSGALIGVSADGIVDCPGHGVYIVRVGATVAKIAI